MDRLTKFKLLFLVLIVFGLIMAAFVLPSDSRADNLGWSTPQTIVSIQGQTIFDPKIAVEGEGSWHVVYKEFAGAGYPYHSYVRYQNSKSVSETIVDAVHPEECQGNHADSASIAVDANGNLHVTYREINWAGVCGEETTSIKYMNNVSGSWSTPQTIVSIQGQTIFDPKIAVEGEGSWHVVYKEFAGAGYPYHSYVRYQNSKSVSETIVDAVHPEECQGNHADSASIAVDANGNLHVTYREINWAGVCGEETTSIKYVNKIAPKLFVVIPGINDTGLTMLSRAANMVRHDFECEVIVREVSGLSVEQVRQIVTDAAMNSKGKGKDVVVLIDMDLEDYSWEFPLPPFLNRWDRAVRWAGEMANIVSDAFTKEVPSGVRMLYAHSAGGDATYESIQRAKQIMYDNINILNGRTAADKLSRALKRNGYGWQQIKVFTSEGDLPATPAPPKYLKLWSGSISNYDAAREWAGKEWVHLHSLTITGHNGLRDSIGIEGTFEVNLGSLGSWQEVGTVEEMMLKDWRP